MAKRGERKYKKLIQQKNNLSLFLLVLLGVHFDGPLQGFVLKVHFWGVTFRGHLGGPFLKKSTEEVQGTGPRKRSTKEVHRRGPRKFTH